MKVRYKYRLRPGTEARRWLHFEANNCRYLWNRLVEGVQAGKWYKESDLTAWRRDLPWLRSGSSMTQQQLFRDFKTAKGRKKFKSSHGYLPSLNYVGFGKSFHLREGKLCLPHGVSIPVVWSRELPSDPSSVRVSQDNLGHWYASFVVEVPDQTNHWAPDDSMLGIDWGLRALATTTTDEEYDLEHPEFAKQAHKNMVRYQRMMSRRAPKPGKKASNGYKYAKRVVAKQHKKIARQRQDHGRKWVRKVVDNHAQIAIENLKPGFMFGSNLARKAGDAGLGNLKKDLIFAADRAGREVQLVHPKNSSITCSECSARNKQNVHASHKRFHCLQCGFKTDRDLNAARNILDTAGRRAFPLSIGAQNAVMVRGLITAAVLALTAIAAPAAGAATHQLYISPRGSDDAAGTASRPLRTVGAAWQRVPRGASGNWHLQLAPGDYRSGAPIYWDERSGSITIEASGVRGSAVLPAINAFGMRGFKLIGLKLIDGGDVFHCEQCNGVLLSRMILRGRGAQETIKINQSSNVTVADSDVAGAGDNAFDAVAVKHLRLLRNHFHSAEDWCAYAKGGSADVIVRGNLFTDCGTGGFTAGQGTGFQFMSWPFVHYEATGVLVEGNTVRHTEGAAFGVNGGANVLIRNNLASRVGSRSHVLEVTYGGRSCDGAPGGDGWSRCGDYLARGGWGNWLVGDGNNYVRIPNRNVLIYDNLIANPDAQASRWQVFEVPGPPEARYEASIPFAVHADAGLHIVGNVIWDGGPGHELGLGGASCLPASTCAAASVIANNSINRRRPAVRLLPDGRLIRTGWASALSNHRPPAPDSLARIGSEPTVWSSWPN